MPKTMRNVVKALRKEGISVRGLSDVVITDLPGKCTLCDHESDHRLLYIHRYSTIPQWEGICSDRPACRRRQAKAEADRVCGVLDVVVI